MTLGNWECSFECKKCFWELSDSQKFYSYGVCPYCGHSSNSTICSTRKRIRTWRWDTKIPWYLKLFGYKDKGHWEYKE